MNCNQLMTLLEIYRTGKVIETVKGDFDVLKNLKLVEASNIDILPDTEATTTDFGSKKVRAILALL